jgi:hypothetical protein
VGQLQVDQNFGLIVDWSKVKTCCKLCVVGNQTYVYAQFFEVTGSAVQFNSRLARTDDHDIEYRDT